MVIPTLEIWGPQAAEHTWMVTWVTQKCWRAENFHKRGSSHIRLIRLTVKEGRREREIMPSLFSWFPPHCFWPRKLVPNTSSKAAHFLAHDFLSTVARKPTPGAVHLEWVYMVDPAFSCKQAVAQNTHHRQRDFPQLSPLSTELVHRSPGLSIQKAFLYMQGIYQQPLENEMLKTSLLW